MEALAGVPMVAMAIDYKMAAMQALTMFIRHFRASSVAILEFMATVLATHSHKKWLP